ncbi:MAG: hypothetical protein K2X57_25590 [Xanthobacteraceae bacterium]|nr:hypothetical protein [Xanthobacteraceae bacterium]
MENFIHRENLALYRKRLEEPHTEAEGEILLKLLAEENKNEAHPKKEESGLPSNRLVQERTDAPDGDQEHPGMGG